MHYITDISVAFLCWAVPKTLSADFSDDAAIPFISPDDASAGDFEVFGDSSGDFTEDFPDLQPGTNDILFDSGFDEYREGLATSATTYALDGCSAFIDQQLGKRIRVREDPALCPVQPTTGSEPQTNSDGNSNGNGHDDDFIFKNNDGIQAEPKNSVGLNHYGTNSDGTICPPNMWLLCSSIEADLEGSCFGCYPYLFIFFSGLVHCEHPRRVLCCEDYNYIFLSGRGCYIVNQFN